MIVAKGWRRSANFRLFNDCNDYLDMEPTTLHMAILLHAQFIPAPQNSTQMIFSLWKLSSVRCQSRNFNDALFYQPKSNRIYSMLCANCKVRCKLFVQKYLMVDLKFLTYIWRPTCLIFQFQICHFNFNPNFPRKKKELFRMFFKLLIVIYLFIDKLENANFISINLLLANFKNVWKILNFHFLNQKLQFLFTYTGQNRC